MNSGNQIGFRELSPPQPRSEDWKYTSLKAFEQQSYEISNWSDAQTKRSISLSDGLDLLSHPGMEGGRLFPQSPLQSPFFKFFSRELQSQEIWFLHQQTPGVLSQIEVNARVEKSGRLLILIEPGEDSLAQINIRMKVAEAQELDLTVCFNSPSVALCRVHISVELAAKSGFKSTSLLMGGRVNRLEPEVFFTVPGWRAELSGLSLASGHQVQDQQVHIHHQVGNCTSDQIFKSLLADQARSVTCGSVRIYEDAVGAESHQLNKNLLLGSQAEAISLPRLEIEADDVVATHGSSTGSLESEELFYLQSRGLAVEEARQMLLAGFSDEIVSRIPQEFVVNVRPLYRRALQRMRGPLP
ncbi:MAG: SufD family Fe-S cluster assembly protein [Bdellovibrio sp.]